MSTLNQRSVLKTLFDSGLIPIFYYHDLEAATHVVEACLNAGARCVEFTNRGDNALDVFAGLADRFADDERLILGIGSILDPATAARYLDSGANFIVGPALKADVAELCNQRSITYIPGCATASEIAAAQELGAGLCKIFPASQLGGPDFIRAILGPMPWSRLMPTGGVSPTKENISAWIDAGAACLGIGGGLIPKDSIAAGNFKTIERKVEAALGFIQEARRNPKTSS